eukprot:g23506.t1
MDKQALRSSQRIRAWKKSLTDHVQAKASSNRHTVHRRTELELDLLCRLPPMQLMLVSCAVVHGLRLSRLN